MSVILLLVPLSLLFAGTFLAGFIWAVRSGQYEDTCTPAMRLLLDEPGSKICGADAPSEKQETDQP